MFGDVRDVLADLPHHPSGTDYRNLPLLFPVRHKLIHKLKPRSVFEFGTLAAYFLVVALDAAPSIRRVEWVDNEFHTPGSNTLAEANVRSYLGKRKVALWWGDDREDAKSRKPVDLVHVDGDHAYESCLADLTVAHDVLKAKTIMVDDWTACPEVQPACRLLCERTGRKLIEVETENGLAVIT